ncbi:MAG: hypothetical protein ACREC4_00275 [Methylocella sp.]
MELAQKAAAEGLTPLEVMLKAMRAHANAKPPCWDKAAIYAEKAAPYIHPRLATVECSGPGGKPLLTNTVIIMPGNGRDDLGTSAYILDQLPRLAADLEIGGEGDAAR